jgi:hypothetical protein
MKRGMSPLMATALLIAFAITFGIFAMVLGGKIEESHSEQGINWTEVCSQADLEFFSLRYNPYLCIDTEEDVVRFIVVNKGKHPIEKIQVVLVGDKVVFREILKEPLGPHYLYEGNISYDVDQFGMIKEIQFLPRVSTLVSKENNEFESNLCMDYPHIITDVVICGEEK